MSETLLYGVSTGMTIVAGMPRQPSVVGDALGMVAGGRRHHARLLGLGCEVCEEVAGAPLLERARELQVLELQEHVGARDLRDGVRSRGRCLGDCPGDRGRGCLDVGGRHGQRHGAHPVTGAGASDRDNDGYHDRVAAVSEPTTSTRARLLAAAVDVFVEQGYEGARVQDIARAAGLTTGAIYANFRGKADLLFDAIGARADAEMDALLAAARTREPRELLEVLGDRLFQPRSGAPLLIDAIAAARRDRDLAGALRAATRRARAHARRHRRTREG